MKVFKWDQEDLDEERNLVYICETPLVIEEQLLEVPTDPDNIWMPVTGIATLKDLIGPLARKSMRAWLVYHRESKRSYMTLEIGGGCERDAPHVDRVYIPDLDDEEKTMVKAIIKTLRQKAHAVDTSPDNATSTDLGPNLDEGIDSQEWEIPDNIVSIFSGRKQR